jgi:hypothetical protein
MTAIVRRALRVFCAVAYTRCTISLCPGRPGRLCVPANIHPRILSVTCLMLQGGHRA